MAFIWSLIFLGMMSGGCGQNKSVGGENGDLAEQADIEEEWQEEENSLAKWEMSLQEGALEELTAESFRGVSVVKNKTPYFAISYEPRTYKNSFDCWAISVPYQSMVTVDTEVMYEFFRTLEDMELTPVDGIMRGEAGIEDTSDRIFVAYYSGQTKEGGQAQPDRGITFYFGNEDEKDGYYVEAGGRIWSADKQSVEKLFTVNPYECILKVVSVVKLETVSDVTIAFGDTQY